MRKIKYLVLCVAIAFSLLAGTACANVDFDYNIDFSADGKIVASAGTDGDRIAMPKDPEKENYSFDGWFWDDGVWEKPFTLNSILDQPIRENNKFTVYAKWKSTVYYTVSFDGNGGSGSMPDKTVAKDEEFTLTNAFTAPAGYVSDGFNSESDGSGKAYGDGATVKNVCEAGETVTLYARWRELEKLYYTVIFDANGGSGNMDVQRFETDAYGKLNYNYFDSPEDAAFDGWNTKADGTGTKYDDGAEVKNLAASGESVTLYAQWRSYYYTVKYDGNGATGSMADEKKLAGWGSYLTKNAFKRAYYAFLGWNTKADGTGAEYGDGAYVFGLADAGGEITLYAQWKLNDGVTFINDASDIEKALNDMRGTYVLTADIDYGGREITPLSVSEYFNGTFDGGGHVIKNFTYTPSKPDFYGTTSGFFGIIGSSGKVCNLGLTGFTIAGFTVGAFAEYNYGVIENCYADGVVNCSDFNFPGLVHAGGIAGSNHGTIKNCLFSGRIIADLTKGVVGAGGITGLNMLSTENCLCTGDILIRLSGTASQEPISYVSKDYVNIGVSSNNYYLSGMTVSLYKDGVPAKCDMEKNSTTKSASSSNLGSHSFYTQTLLWDDAVWDLTALDASTAKYPVLIKK